MAKNSKETSGITLPWDEKATTSNVIRCPQCGNNGQDGTITGYSGTYGVRRKCLKCKQEWSGGIGVQIADFSEPLPIPGVERMEEVPEVKYTGGQFRNPNKNYSDDEES
jgi:DNA-directed RNA polymerase subunit RPC12/RpoP